MKIFDLGGDEGQTRADDSGSFVGTRENKECDCIACDVIRKIRWKAKGG